MFQFHFHLQGWSFKSKYMAIRQQLRMNMAEIKILIALCYYFLLGAFILAAITIPASNHSNFIADILEYFLCESTGTNPNKKVCERKFEKFDSRMVILATFLIVGMFPIVNLLYVLNVQEIKKILSRRRLKKRRTQLTRTTQTSLSQFSVRAASSTEM